jgi:hypothetical protein
MATDRQQLEEREEDDVDNAGIATSVLEPNKKGGGEHMMEDDLWFCFKETTGKEKSKDSSNAYKSFVTTSGEGSSGFGFGTFDAGSSAAAAASTSRFESLAEVMDIDMEVRREVIRTAAERRRDGMT